MIGAGRKASGAGPRSRRKAHARLPHADDLGALDSSAHGSVDDPAPAAPEFGALRRSWSAADGLSREAAARCEALLRPAGAHLFVLRRGAPTLTPQ